MTHTVEILSVGTELLLGNTVNSDAQLLSRELAGLGLNVYYHTVVGDNPKRVKDAVKLARSRADIIVTTGGLGPTCDDLTKQVLAEAFEKELEYHPAQADRIRAYFDAIGREMTENNLQQAYLPEGCTVLENEWGTAPGCAFESGGCRVVMLPGPPRECLPMFREKAAPWLGRLSEGVIRSRALRIFGMGEAQVESMLRDRMNGMTNPTLAPYAKDGEMELRITAKAETEDAAYALIAPVEAELRALLGAVIYGTEEDSLESVALGLLKEQGLTLGTAESCTGGLIAKRITDLPGASSAFMGAMVSYTDQVKEQVLGIPPALLEEKGAVSPETAAEMAKGVRRVLGCDIALSVTGVAGPEGDGRDNPVGLVYLGLADADGCQVRRLKLGSLSRGRDRVRTMAASSALDLLRRRLLGML